MQMMRDDSVSVLDLRERNIGVQRGLLHAYFVPVMGSLTVTNLLHNELDAESSKMLAEVAKQKGSRSAASSATRPPLTFPSRVSSRPF